MDNLTEIYEEVEKAYYYYVKEENYTELQSLYSLIEEFARLITKSKHHKAMFYTALMKLIQDKGIDEKQCVQIIDSYKTAVKSIK